MVIDHEKISYPSVVDRLNVVIRVWYFVRATLAILRVEATN